MELVLQITDSTCRDTGLFYEILRVRQFPVVQMHVPLGRRDVRTSQQVPGVLDSLLTAKLRPAFVAGEVQYQSPRQTGHVTQPRIRPAEVGDLPRLARRRQEHRAFRPLPDCLVQQLAELPADPDAPRLPGLAGGLMLFQRDD